MDIQISFQRKKFNKATEDFLCSKMDEENDSDLIANLRILASGVVKKLKLNDVNALPILKAKKNLKWKPNLNNMHFVKAIKAIIT